MHAFDAYTNTDESRAIIKRTVAFLKDNLETPVAGTQFTLTNRNYMWLMMNGQAQKALSEFRKARVMYHNDTSYTPFYNSVLREEVLNANAYWLLHHQKQDEALETFRLAVETYPESPNAYDGLADGYEAIGNKAEAVKNAQLALQKLDKAVNIHARFKELIRASAAQKIERLKQ
jgi:tetratricopeptide (TPR) repeat protein